MGAIIINGIEYGGSQPYPATSDRLGYVKPDNTTITVDENGTITAAIPRIATVDSPGIVKPDGVKFTVSEDGTISYDATADDTRYDNSVSQAEFTTVQQAIDALLSEIKTLKARLDEDESSFVRIK